MPLIILGGIYGGIFTPTEAAAIACLYTMVISLTIYRKPKVWNMLWEALSESVTMTCVIGAMIVGALIVGKMFGYLGIPQALTNLVVALNFDPFTYLLVGLGIIILLGCFMDNMPILFIVVPILVHTGMTLGIHPLYMAMVWFVGLELGQSTPPIGMSLYIAAAIGKVRLEDTIKGAIPFLVALLVSGIIRILFPALSLWLPQLMSR